MANITEDTTEDITENITENIRYSRLVVTFFSRGRYEDAPGDFTTAWLDPFDSILLSLAPFCLPARDEYQVHYTRYGLAQMQYTIQHDTPKHEKLDYAKLRHHPLITQFETTKQVEIILDHYPCPESPNTSTQHFSRPLKLALFDMDSTLINEEVIDELARSIGISAAVSAITARAMNGDIDFETSLKERVAMLKGVPVTVWQELKTQVTIAEGARELISGLKKRGVLTVVVSGGFMPMAEWLKGELGLDVAVANHLVEEGPTEKFPYPHLSGQLDTKSKIVTPERKKDTLLSLAKAHSIDIHETMAVGDGSNDLLMLHAAGLGIAFRAKPKVQAAAPMRLNGQSLAELLWLFGPEPPSASDALA